MFLLVFHSERDIFQYPISGRDTTTATNIGFRSFEGLPQRCTGIPTSRGPGSRESAAVRFHIRRTSCPFAVSPRRRTDFHPEQLVHLQFPDIQKARIAKDSCCPDHNYFE